MEGAVKIDIPAGQDNRGLYGCLAGNSGEDGEQKCLGERESDCVLQAQDCDGWGCLHERKKGFVGLFKI